MSPGFASPPNPKAYNALVWDIVRQVPPGQVCTYGQIAAMIPPPEGLAQPDYDAFAPRWVGGAMAACPSGVPWQRVINAQGKISLRKGGDIQAQRILLEAEGVEFDDRERVDLETFGWDGPPESWLKERGLLPPPSLRKPRQTKMPL
jgi:methylated-DNA-protein-cysteine methyltransferase related protein